MKVTKDGNLIKILPTGAADTEANLIQPLPRVEHVTYTIDSTFIHIHDLFWSHHESCVFADFVGDIAYTTPSTIGWSLFMDS